MLRQKACAGDYVKIDLKSENLEDVALPMRSLVSLRMSKKRTYTEYS